MYYSHREGGGGGEQSIRVWCLYSYFVHDKYYCSNDPQWEEWHSTAFGVQGGLEDHSSSESEEEGYQDISLSHYQVLVCARHCRLVLLL